jgi:hypothetical protein
LKNPSFTAAAAAVPATSAANPYSAFLSDFGLKSADRCLGLKSIAARISGDAYDRRLVMNRNILT